jgi:hypothetical protein
MEILLVMTHQPGKSYLIDGTHFPHKDSAACKNSLYHIPSKRGRGSFGQLGEFDDIFVQYLFHGSMFTVSGVAAWHIWRRLRYNGSTP